MKGIGTLLTMVYFIAGLIGIMALLQLIGSLIGILDTDWLGPFITAVIFFGMSFAASRLLAALITWQDKHPNV